MAALVTVAPVLVMIAIGLFSRMRQLITPEQKEGANNLVLNLFFPVLIFSLLFQAQIDSSVLGLVLFLFAMYLVIMLLSATVLKKFFAPYDNIAPYLMVTVEGGNLAYPLFVSLAGAGASHTVLIDIAGMLLCFCVLPVLIAKAVATKSASGNKVSIRDIFYLCYQKSICDCGGFRYCSQSHRRSRTDGKHRMDGTLHECRQHDYRADCSDSAFCCRIQYEFFASRA